MNNSFSPQIKNNFKYLLNEGWQFFKTSPNTYSSPDDFVFSNQKELIEVNTPCTVAMAYSSASVDSWRGHINYDDFDWWFEKKFILNGDHKKQLLILEGLATLAKVWLNGELVLTSQNMFHEHKLDVESLLNDEENELIIYFPSLSEELDKKRPRPRWKTKLVKNQYLRWFRTTLIGRITNWTPPVVAVGPWKPIYLMEKAYPQDVKINTTFESGIASVYLSCQLPQEKKITAASLKINNSEISLSIKQENNFHIIYGGSVVESIELWWPHTHGDPKLYTAELIIQEDNEKRTFTLPKIGFKSVKVEQNNNNFQLKVNDQAIFCRGACWTLNDITSILGEPDQLIKTLTLMRDAGANMIRIGGTMIYEQDLFYDACDQLGILIWQDFMFANFDYPFEDELFLQSVKKEAKQTLCRLSNHACIAIYCGNSEVQQQAAMLGFDSSYWEISFFEKTLLEYCKQEHPLIPYVPSSPSGGDLPFKSNQGLSHYYGVGAYLKPVSEVRKHDVKFTSECLGFANIPVSTTRNTILNNNLPVIHHPDWKIATPRDVGTGWDFEDVRDHYLEQFFKLNPSKLRSFNSEKYFRFSEAITGEVMFQVFSEWRSEHSHCNGGIIWFMKDFMPGAGWGIIDSYSLPKACYYYLKRAWQPLSILITDESINGLHIHGINETTDDFSGYINVELFDKKSTIIASKQKDFSINAQSKKVIALDKVLGQFYDTTYSYRFGPQSHYSIVIQLKNLSDNIIREAFYFVDNQIPPEVDSKALDFDIKEIDEDTILLKLLSSKQLYSINIELLGFLPDDNFFHMAPNTERTIKMIKNAERKKTIKGSITALNLDEVIYLKI